GHPGKAAKVVAVVQRAVAGGNVAPFAQRHVFLADQDRVLLAPRQILFREGGAAGPADHSIPLLFKNVANDEGAVGMRGVAGSVRRAIPGAGGVVSQGAGLVFALENAVGNVSRATILGRMAPGGAVEPGNLDLPDGGGLLVVTDLQVPPAQ